MTKTLNFKNNFDNSQSSSLILCNNFMEYSSNILSSTSPDFWLNNIKVFIYIWSNSSTFNLETILLSRIKSVYKQKKFRFL